MAKPRETGGNVPGAKTKKVRKVTVKVAPEATRPVTPKQRQAINQNVARVRKQVVGRQVAQAQTLKQQPDTPQAQIGSKVATINARSQKVDRLQREAADLNAGKKKVTLIDPAHGISSQVRVKGSLLRSRKVVVKNGKLVLHTGSVLGMGGSDLPLAGGTRSRTYGAVAGVDEATKRITAPALKVLHVAAIPGQAIGKQVEKATGSKAAGFVGSIALDPTTYLTFGRSKVATTLAQKAGEAEYRAAIKAGATHAVATKKAAKVANKVEQTAPQNKGIQVKLGGKSTSGRATAYVSRKTGLSKVATKVRESKVVQGLGQDLRPDFRPKGLSEAEHKAIRGASREARAQTTRGRVEAISKAQALKKALKPEDHAKVVNAIERGTVYNLPEHLRVPARDVELAFRKARRSEVKAGIKVGNRRQYFTHALDEQATEGKASRGGGKKVIRPVYGKTRQHGGTIEQIAAKGGPEFSTNIPSVVAGRLSKSAGDVAQARMNRALGAAGRKVKYGEQVHLGDGEALFRLHGSDIPKVTNRWEEEHVLAGTKKPPKKGNVQYVVLNEKAVENAVKSVNPGASRSSIGKGYDKVQGGFKFIATVPNPGFHARNLYGDTFNAYLGQSTVGLARNLGHSARGLRALGKQEEAARSLTVHKSQGAGSKAARRAVSPTREIRTPAKTTVTVRKTLPRKRVEVFDEAATRKAIERNARKQREYDPTPDAMSRKTWFHGTGREIKSSAEIDASRGEQIRNLFGAGFYMTDDPVLARSYAKARSRNKSPYAKDAPTPRLYAAKVHVKKVLNLEGRQHPEFVDALRGVIESAGYEDKAYYRQQFDEALHGTKTNAEAYQAFKHTLADIEQDYPGMAAEVGFDLNVALREKGYDALTHRGGNATGSSLKHQVMILLDPADIAAVGGKSPFKQFGEHPDIKLPSSSEIVSGRKVNLTRSVVGEEVRRVRSKPAPLPRLKTAGVTVKGKYGGKEFLTYDQVAKEAVNSGAIRSGFISREIPELLRDTSKAASSREFGRHLKRVVQNREDLIRLATYIGARKRGLTAREATDYAAQHHFDYADLTEFERGTLRRLLPFYTFSARNIPLQAKKLVTNPGKFANLEKIREAMAQQSGLPSDWQSRIPEYQQRGIPFPVAIHGKPFLVSPSLPVSDLNQLALPHVTTKDFSSGLTEQGKKFLSMLNPVIKDPVELYANYNSFFRSQIQNPDSPLVAAPSYVALWPASIRRKFGIVPDYVDKRSGKKGWGWPAKVDYVAKAIPGPPNAIQQLLSPLANRRGQGETGKLVSYFTGLKPDPYDPTSTAINNGYAMLDALNERAAGLRQRGQGKTEGRRETKEYDRVTKQIKDITAMIDTLKRQRGDKNVKVRKARPTGNLISASSGPSVSDILGHDAPTLNDILGP